jgi:hypothetical protein
MQDQIGFWVDVLGILVLSIRLYPQPLGVKHLISVPVTSERSNRTLPGKPLLSLLQEFEPVPDRLEGGKQALRVVLPGPAEHPVRHTLVADRVALPGDVWAVSLSPTPESERSRWLAEPASVGDGGDVPQVVEEPGQFLEKAVPEFARAGFSGGRSPGHQTQSRPPGRSVLIRTILER